MRLYMLRVPRRTGGARTFLLTSPHAPSVVPMFLMTLENTVFRSCFSTACSWYVCRVVSLRVLLPNCMSTGAGVRDHGPHRIEHNPSLHNVVMLLYTEELLYTTEVLLEKASAQR